MYRILIAIILMLPTFSQAVNYLGFGGGNYVYAEQGNLYFNLDPYVFDNRAWTYDKTTGFSSEIKVNMDLKTKYTSDDWLEQVIASKKKSDGIMYANYIKQPFNYQNRGQYQQTWFWLARMAPTVGGFIGRTAAWGAFKNFALKNAAKNAVMGGALAYFLEVARTDGVNCDEVDCSKLYKYEYEVTFSANQNLGVPKFNMTAEEYADRFNVAAQRVPQTYNYNGTTYNFSQCEYANSKNYCVYTSPKGNLSFGFDIKKIEAFTAEKAVEDRDLLKYFDEVCAKFPSECINEPTQGKNIKDVQLTGGVVGSPVNVVGPPYTNPITGTSQQDQVIIGGASSGIGVHSGTNSAWEYTPSLGQSGTLNPTNVTSIPRPDLTNTDTAPVAKPNEQTGTKPQTVNPSVPDINIEFPEFTDIAEFCQQNPTAGACLQSGTGEEAESIFDKIKIPEINLPTEFSKDNFLPATAACPAPTSIVTSHGTIMYSYEKHCEIAAFLRPIILIMATITGLFIIIRSKD